MKKVMFLMLIIAACNNDDSPEQFAMHCDTSALEVSADEYNATGDFGNHIVNIEIDEDCLIVTDSDSGCDDSWPVNLITPDVYISNGLVPQRPFKISIDNSQVCLAVFQKTVSFDLTKFQPENTNQLILDIQGWEDEIVYEF